MFVTHDRNEASVFGDRVGVLIGGRLIQVGVTAEVFSRPANETVAEFVGVDTRIFGTVEESTAAKFVVRVAGGAIRACGTFQTGERVLVCIRPENMGLRPAIRGDLNHNGFNELLANIVKIRPWAAHLRVELDCGGDRMVALVSRSSLLDLDANEGEQVMVSFKETAVHVIKQGWRRSRDHTA